MKKITARISALAFSSATYLSLATSALAADGVAVDPCPRGAQNGTDFSSLCNLNANNIGSVVSSVITVLLIGAAIIALFFLIWGGIRWITSGGDKSKVDSARQTIIASLIGLIVALLAFFIITIVLGLFNLSLTNLKLPKLS